MSSIVNSLITMVLLVFVVLSLSWYLYTPEAGAFSKVRDATTHAKELLPNVSVGEKEITAQKPTFRNPKHKEEITRLRETIARMQSSESKYCLASYGGFTPFKAEDTSIMMMYDQATDATRFTIRGGVAGKQVLRDESFVIEGMVPCVIGGSEDIVRNFYKGFLDSNDPWKERKENIPLNHFNPVPMITVGEGAKINYGRGFVEMNDYGYIYTPDNQHICFFPTMFSYACEHLPGEEEVKEGCFKPGFTDDEFYSQTNDIPYQLTGGTLLRC